MESVIVVQKASKAETKQRLTEKSRKDDEKALDVSMGFSKVIRMISESVCSTLPQSRTCLT